MLAFVERIDIHNSETVLKYGNAAQTKISQFSDKILEDVKTKDTGAISDMLTKLVAELKGFDVDEGKKGGLFGLFKKAGNNIAQLRAKYDKVEANVAEIIATLKKVEKAKSQKTPRTKPCNRTRTRPRSERRGWQDQSQSRRNPAH